MTPPNEWANRSTLITGGAGFIGSNLARRLVSMGAQVRLVDNLERGRMEYIEPVIDRVELVECDLRDLSATRSVMQDIAVVFHLASKVGSIQVYINQPSTILSDNLRIDQNVFQSALEAGVRSLFYASSAHVYPANRQQSPDAPPLHETDAYPAAPGLTYGWAKLMGEQALMALAQEQPWFRASIARIVGAYGINQDIALETASAIPAFCHRAARWPDLHPFCVHGTGEETRSYCFIDDVLDAILLSIDCQKTNNLVGPFNLGTEGRATIREIAEIIIEVSGKEIKMEFDPSFQTPLWGQAVDCSLARSLLNGWEAGIGLREGLRKTYGHVEDRVHIGM